MKDRQENAPDRARLTQVGGEVRTELCTYGRLRATAFPLILAGLAMSSVAGAQSTGSTDTPAPATNRFNCFTPPHIAECLRSLDRHFSTRSIAPSETPSPLPSEPWDFDGGWTVEGKDFELADFVERTRTTGLLILIDGKVALERYFLGASAESRFSIQSISKSVTSTLVGIALQDGLIKSVQDPITQYLGDLAGTGFDGATIEDILQMSSGIDFNEGYAERASDIARLGIACYGGPERVDELSRTYQRKWEPGTRFEYASVNTTILGRLLRSVIDEPLSDYASRKLWKPMGAEFDASWIVDLPNPDAGVECALGGMSVSLRDLARFGRLFARDGMVEDRRVLPVGWPERATVPSEQHLVPGSASAVSPLGYQYQWWVPPGDDQAFAGLGIHGQFLLVNPKLDLVVAKTSAWESAWNIRFEAETLAFFKALEELVRQHDRGR